VLDEFGAARRGMQHRRGSDAHALEVRRSGGDLLVERDSALAAASSPTATETSASILGVGRPASSAARATISADVCAQVGVTAFSSTASASPSASTHIPGPSAASTSSTGSRRAGERAEAILVRRVVGPRALKAQVLGRGGKPPKRGLAAVAAEHAAQRRHRSQGRMRCHTRSSIPGAGPARDFPSCCRNTPGAAVTPPADLIDLHVASMSEPVHAQATGTRASGIQAGLCCGATGLRAASLQAVPKVERPSRASTNPKEPLHGR
jgi:hypothetical protein